MSGPEVDAVLFRHEIVRYLVSRFCFRHLRPLWSTWLAPIGAGRLSLRVDPPPGWVRLRIRLSGICGSDLQVVTGQDSLYLEPEATYPFVPGHEVVAAVASDQDVPENDRGVRAGDRVAVWPVLGCRASGEDPPCARCAEGWDGLCERRAGSRWPGSGLAIGFNRDTGGGWSHECLAHVSQLWPVPASVEDSDALLLDPASTALGALLRGGDSDRVERTLVVGGGTIGILTALLARALGVSGRVQLIVRHEAQRRWAEEVGLHAIRISGEREFTAWAMRTGMPVARVPGYGPVVRGTFDRVVDAAGTPSSLRWAMASTRAGGELVLTTAPAGRSDADLTPLWYRGIRCRGVNVYGPVRWEGRWIHPYELLLPRLASGSLRLRDLHTHTFPLTEFRRAIATALRRDGGAIKVALSPERRQG